MHFGPEVGGEGIDAAHADPVQTPGDLVAVLVEFSAGTNLGHHDLQGTDAFLLVDADRNAPAVVVDGHPIAGRDGHADGVTVSGKGLVNRVVDHLVDQVVQSPCAHISDVHRGTLPHVFHALEGLNAAGVIALLLLFAHLHNFGRLAKIARGLPKA